MSKAIKCKQIFDELVALHTTDGETNFKAFRSTAIDRFVSEAGCTIQGAATYYANCKNRGGLTGSYIRKATPTEKTEYVDNETQGDDERQLFSAVVMDAAGFVIGVSSYMNVDDALTNAENNNGIAVVGSPEIGDALLPDTIFHRGNVELVLLKLAKKSTK